MSEASITVPDGGIINTYFELAGGDEAMDTLLEHQFDGTNACAGNDEMAFGFRTSCRSSGLITA